MKALDWSMRCTRRSTAHRPKVVPDCHGVQGWQDFSAGEAEDHCAKSSPSATRPTATAWKATASKGAMDAVTDEEGWVEGSSCWRRPKAF